MRRRRGEAAVAPEADQGQLWRWRDGSWERFPLLDTTATHVPVHEKTRTPCEWTIPQNIHALDRAALLANGWADYASKWSHVIVRYFTDEGRAEVDRLRVDPVAYPLLGLPAGLPKPFVVAAFARAERASYDEAGQNQHAEGLTSEAGHAIWVAQREHLQQLREERDRAEADGDRSLVGAAAILVPGGDDDADL